MSLLSHCNMTIFLYCRQFFPVFERECVSVAMSQGIIPPRGFSARKLFQRISSSVRLIPAMIRAVQLIKKAGGIKKSFHENCIYKI